MKRLTIGVAALLVLLGVGQVIGAIVSAEPDDVPPFTDVTNAYPGVTLSLDGIFTGNVESYAFGAGATTGSQIFIPRFSDGGASLTWWEEPGSVLNLRADFDLATDFVSIDAKADDNVTAFLRAFDGGGTLLETVSEPLSWSEIAALSVDRASADIAYVIASSTPEESFLGGGVFLDNLSFNLIPEPSTVVLLSLGALSLLGYGWLRRGRTV